MSVLIKFLGGLQAGSEVILPPGEYVLGSGDDCDLALADVAARPRHARLHVGENGWEIEPLDDGEVRLDGVSVSGRSPVAPFQVVTIGGTHIAFGPDGPWETVPGIPAPALAPPAAGGESEEKASSAEPGETGSGPAAVERAAATGKGGWRWVIAVLLPAALGAAAWYGYTQVSGAPEERLAVQVAERLAAADVPVAANRDGPTPPGFVSVRPVDGGRIRLSGLLATQEEKGQALDAAGLVAATVEDGLTTAQDQVETLKAELLQVSPDGRIAVAGERFSVQVSGVVTGTELEALNRLMRQRLDDRIRIRRRLWQWRDLAREAERHMERLGLAGARLVLEDGQPRLVSGEALGVEESSVLMEVIAEQLGQDAARFLAPALAPTPVEPVYEPEPEPEPELEPEPEPEPVAVEVHLPPEPVMDEPPVVEQEPPPPPKMTPLMEFLKVTRIHGNGFIDHNGRNWRIGDTVFDGYSLTRVWRNGVVLQKRDELFFVPAGATIFSK